MNKQKRLFSGSKLIYSGADDFTPVEVFERGNWRFLSLAGKGRLKAISHTNMYLPAPHAIGSRYIFDMLLLLLFNPTPKSVLILGVGGGDMVKFFQRFFPKCRIDAVEISPLVIEVAHNYFLMPTDGSIHMHETDAHDFLKTTRRHYDMIFADMFIGEKELSPGIRNLNFFKMCKKRLTPTGRFAWNGAALTQKQLNIFLEHLSLTFGRRLAILHLANGGSFLFLAAQKPEQYTRKMLEENARLLSQTTQYPFLKELKHFQAFQNVKHLPDKIQKVVQDHNIQPLISKGAVKRRQPFPLKKS